MNPKVKLELQKARLRVEIGNNEWSVVSMSLLCEQITAATTNLNKVGYHCCYPVTVATVEDLAVEPGHLTPKASCRHCIRHHHRCTSVSSEARIIKKEIVLYC
jgi:hypothetical protein